MCRFALLRATYLGMISFLVALPRAEINSGFQPDKFNIQNSLFFISRHIVIPIPKGSLWLGKGTPMEQYSTFFQSHPDDQTPPHHNYLIFNIFYLLFSIKYRFINHLTNVTSPYLLTTSPSCSTAVT